MEKINKNFIPENLTEPEIKVWTTVAPDLIELGIIDHLNYISLSRYCTLSVRVEETVNKYPTHSSLPALYRTLRAMENELCISPNARQRWENAKQKWEKDQLIIEDRKRKSGKNKEQVVDEYKESFFKK